MSDVAIETSESVVVVKLKGDLTIRYISELKTTLLDVLKKSKHLVINIDDTAEIDFSCLQLFCSLHKEIIKRQKDFELFYEGNQSFKNLILNTGYFRHIGCTLDTKRQCLWLGGVL